MPTRADRPDQPHLCFVCGLDVVGCGEDAPWGEDGASPSYDYCPCCGVEFGYGDFVLEGARKWRAAWVERGTPWDRAELRPDPWNSEEQLEHLPERAR